MNPRLEALTLLLWILGSALQFLSPNATSLLGMGLAGLGILIAAADRLRNRRRPGLEMAVGADKGDASGCDSAEDRDLN